MIELDDVGIAIGDTAIVRGLSATLSTAGVVELTGGTVLARASIISAIAGIQPHSGSITIAGRANAPRESSVYVVFADASLGSHLNGYANVRLLSGPAARRSAIDEAAELVPGANRLAAHGRDLSLAERHRVHLVAAIVSGARNIVIDRMPAVPDGVTGSQLDALGVALGATIVITSACATSRANEHPIAFRSGGAGMVSA